MPKVYRQLDPVEIVRADWLALIQFVNLQHCTGLIGAVYTITDFQLLKDCRTATGVLQVMSLFQEDTLGASSHENGISRVHEFRDS